MYSFWLCKLVNLHIYLCCGAKWSDSIVLLPRFNLDQLSSKVCSHRHMLTGRNATSTQSKTFWIKRQKGTCDSNHFPCLFSISATKPLWSVICWIREERAGGCRAPSPTSAPSVQGWPPSECQHLGLDTSSPDQGSVIPQRCLISDYCLGADLASASLDMWHRFGDWRFSKAHQHYLHSSRNV